MNATSATAGIALGCLGLLMLGLQPLLLGALLDEHRVSVAQLSQAATAEQLMIGVVAGLLGGFAPRRHLRLVAAIACLILAGGNAGCLTERGAALVICRAICGVGGGALMWIASAIVAFSRAPARYSGIFVGSQALSQFGLAAILPVTLISALGANGGFVTMAALSGAGLAVCFFLPSTITNPTRERSTARRVNTAAIAGLVASFCFMAAIVGFWVFVEPLAALNHVPTWVAQYSVAANLAAQIVGASLCVIFAGRLATSATTVLSLSAIAFLLAMAMIWRLPGSIPFVAAVLIHGVIWTTGLTLFTPLMIFVDPTRRGAMLLSGALLLGGSGGPLMTGWFATDTHLSPVLSTAAALAVAWLIAVRISSLLRRNALPSDLAIQEP